MNQSMENIVDLALLIALQAVLGFDNLLYISLESKRAPLENQKSVRIWGIGLAVGLRICLLFLLLFMLDSFKKPWFNADFGWMHVEMNFAAPPARQCGNTSPHSWPSSLGHRSIAAPASTFKETISPPCLAPST